MDGTSDGGRHGAVSTKSLPLNGEVTIAATYRVLKRIGGGGMGDVYEAEHLRLGSRVAIKVMRASTDARAAERFGREARRIAQVRSEHVVRVFDHGLLDDGTPFLVMERLVGEDLRRLMAREGALPVRRAIRLVLDACRGLSAVHRAGFVHRDLKPANLFVERESTGAETCRILDFGVARAVGDSSNALSTIVGTIRYMSPEQIEDSACVTSAADIYSLASVLYECLTGVPPHAGESLEETLFDIVHRNVRPPSLHRSLPVELNDALVRALSRVATERFATVDDFAAALAPFGSAERLRAQPVDDFGDTVISASEAPRARTGGHALRTAVIAFAAAVGGAAMGWSARAPTSLRPHPPGVVCAPSAFVRSTAGSVPKLQPPALKAVAATAESPREVASGKRPMYRNSTPEALQSSALPAETGKVLPPRFDPTNPYE